MIIDHMQELVVYLTEKTWKNWNSLSPIRHLQTQKLKMPYNRIGVVNRLSIGIESNGIGIEFRLVSEM